MSLKWFPNELWCHIKSYLLLDKYDYKLLRKLTKLCLTTLIEIIWIFREQLTYLKNSKISLIIRKKYAINVILKLCKKHKTTEEIIQYVYDEEKKQSKELSWRYEFNNAEEVLVYNIILIDGVYKYVKRKGIIISVNLKSISVLPYKCTIISSEKVNKILWNENEFEKRVVIYNRYNIFKCDV